MEKIVLEKIPNKLFAHFIAKRIMRNFAMLTAIGAELTRYETTQLERAIMGEIDNFLILCDGNKETYYEKYAGE
jgi:hypothetical protein